MKIAGDFLRYNDLLVRKGIIQERESPRFVEKTDSSNSVSGVNPEISAVIPVFNEAGRISCVLEVLQQVDRLFEIIVVDDGSTDSSAEEIQHAAQSDPRIQLVKNSENRGKGEAIFLGWRATESQNLLLLDGDLLGLKPQHVLDLMNPILENAADMVVGQFKRGYWPSDIAHLLGPWLSGQRSLRAELLNQVSVNAAAGYGFETALTVTARLNEWRCHRVVLSGVWHIPGEARRGFWKGLNNRARMYRQIGMAWYLAGGFQRSSPRLRVR